MEGFAIDAQLKWAVTEIAEMPAIERHIQHSFEPVCDDRICKRGRSNEQIRI